MRRSVLSAALVLLALGFIPIGGVAASEQLSAGRHVRAEKPVSPSV